MGFEKEMILSDICEYYKENYGQALTQEQAKELPVSEQLSAYLSWNGIFGYTDEILTIFKGLK